MTPPKEKIKIPGIIASPLSYRLVKRSELDSWNPTIEDINKHTYDYVRLHRVSGTIDIGLPKPFTLAVTFDGGFILPAIEKFKDINNAVDEFNNFFGSILLGGVFVQAIDATYVQRCAVSKIYYFKTIHSPLNAFVELKNSFRHKHSSVKDNIILLDTEFILLRDVHDAYEKGKIILSQIKNLSSQFLVKGVSSYINNSFAESLINNWLSTEQLIDFIWENRVIANSDKKIIGRADFLKDNRTWSTSAKVEVFYQLKLINEGLYNLISLARKSRNYFVHTGKNPKKEEAKAAFNALFQLLSLCITNFKQEDQFDDVLNKYEQLDPIKRTFYDKRKTEFKIEEVSYWLEAPMPSIPGDDDWKGEEYKYDIEFAFEKNPSA